MGYREWGSKGANHGLPLILGLKQGSQGIPCSNPKVASPHERVSENLIAQTESESWYQAGRSLLGKPQDPPSGCPGTQPHRQSQG